jgi:hypothetical protein
LSPAGRVDGAHPPGLHQALRQALHQALRQARGPGRAV